MLDASEHSSPLSTFSRCLLGVAAFIDRLTDLCGRSVAWLTLAMVCSQCLVVIMRYGANLGSIALQESVMYLHTCVFMLGCAYTAKAQGHVRVDIFYRNASPRRKQWLNLWGNLLLLLPFCLFTVWVSWDYVSASWSVRETSAEAGGLPMLYLIKTLIPLLALSLLLYAIADTIRQALSLLGIDAVSNTDAE